MYDGGSGGPDGPYCGTKKEVVSAEKASLEADADFDWQIAINAGAVDASEEAAWKRRYISSGLERFSRGLQQVKPHGAVGGDLEWVRY
jgi:hypothetical protein